MNPYPQHLEEAIEWLSKFGKEKDDGVTRLVFSRAWNEAQHALKDWMETLGLLVSFDSVGNLFGRLPAREEDAPTILVGSHVDTVRSGGKYDGAYGILAALLAVAALKKEYGAPKLNLEVVSLCEEEGSRFPLACLGSGLMTGLYESRDLKGLTDSEGMKLEDAMKMSGFSLPGGEYTVRTDIDAFIEIHIEQGPALEKLRKQIGIVQAIVGQKRYQVTVTGEYNHAGTASMHWRKDALMGAAEMICALYESMGNREDQLVATVGQLFVKPNIPNVIPGRVVFSVDARHPSEETLESFCRQFSRQFLEISADRGLGTEIKMCHEVHPVQMNQALIETVQDICVKREISYQLMNSGAGHDSQLFAKVYPTALLFVPSQGGISHSPLEYTPVKDLETGLDVLKECLHQLAY
ncbi:Zn-dependent hydrolase [Peribacillus sp. SCS-155]|uniref:Zn-dependent hydrolase n=1 Tax=Peribacillus sedimenti TaxID=3115297 RepID=UPI0039060CAC